MLYSLELAHKKHAAIANELASAKRAASEERSSLPLTLTLTLTPTLTLSRSSSRSSLTLTLPLTLTLTPTLTLIRSGSRSSALRARSVRPTSAPSRGAHAARSPHSAATRCRSES